MLAGGVLFIVLALVVLARRYPTLFETIVKDAARGTVEQDEDEENEDVVQKRFRSIKSKLKIILGVLLD